MSKFSNPYASDDKGTLKPLTIDVGASDYNFIKCIRPQQGTLSVTVTLLWKKLCNELKQRNITDVSSYEQFESFVTNCRFITPEELEQRGIPNKSPERVDAKTGGGNERTRTKRVR